MLIPCASRRGFSLIELMVVVVLLAIMAALASVPVSGALARQDLSRSVQLIRLFDLRLRHQAQLEREPVKGLIDHQTGRLVVLVDGDPVKSFQLPQSVAVQAIGNVNRGIEVAGNGDAVSYAVQLACRGATQWVLVVGGSGQVLVDVDPRSVKMLLGVQ
ncbi:hypothetical protein SV7mr_04880 [Stieleria bergensis]|uniref:Type II secretion system protein H n=1 Tax=Stieleria bergensis TaxID=2528025 RepID=A0A517SPG6_9BACT|nr:MAG: hypothetical protein CBB71_08485 [Rhodopirellula sp. TMED11]QDT57999.1 hypothetical protein SV7mr_04880 [Planctomycetes bacterium SV_7m_r]